MHCFIPYWFLIPKYLFNYIYLKACFHSNGVVEVKFCRDHIGHNQQIDEERKPRVKKEQIVSNNTIYQVWRPSSDEDESIVFYSAPPID